MDQYAQQGSSNRRGSSQQQGAIGGDLGNSNTNDTSELDTSQEEIRGLSCQICYQSFAREGEHVPRNLQCGHTYCTSCLNRLVGQYCIGTVRCPTCKYETLINGFMDDVNQLPKNFGVLEILSAADDDQRRKNPAMPKRPPPRPPGNHSSSERDRRGAVGGSGDARASVFESSDNNTSNYESYERRCSIHEGLSIF